MGVELGYLGSLARECITVPHGEKYCILPFQITMHLHFPCYVFILSLIVLRLVAFLKVSVVRKQKEKMLPAFCLVHERLLFLVTISVAVCDFLAFTKKLKLFENVKTVVW